MVTDAIEIIWRRFYANNSKRIMDLKKVFKEEGITGTLCEICGHTNTSSEKFCTNCGACLGCG